MMKVLIVLATFSVALSYGQTTTRPPIDDVTYFDCTGQHGTYHQHPWDCTRFIQCHNGRAADQPCASCKDTGRLCPDDFLNWVSGPTCDWPTSAASCVGYPPTPTEDPWTPPPPTSTTTEDPGTPPPPPPTTTEDPGTPPPPPPTTTEDPGTPAPPGDSCDPKDCRVRGDCRSFWWCKRISDESQSPDEETGEVVRAECDDGLWFNPQATNSSVHGGTCDNWINLPVSVREEYDRECVCNFFAVGNCSPLYIYQDAEPKGSDNWVNQTLSCPSGLNWNQDKRVCSSDPC